MGPEPIDKMTLNLILSLSLVRDDLKMRHTSVSMAQTLVFNNNRNRFQGPKGVLVV